MSVVVWAKYGTFKMWKNYKNTFLSISFVELLLLVLSAIRLLFVACARQFIVDYFAITMYKKTRKSKYLKS